MSPGIAGTVRVVAGRHRGRRIEVPRRCVRPTQERVRAALFDMLSHNAWSPAAGPLPRGARVLDAFAGSGALGIEALSRGAAEACFLETDAGARATLGRNIDQLGEAAHTVVLARDATAPGARPDGPPFALALVDAPYGSGSTAPCLAALAASDWLVPGAVAAVELDAGTAFAPPDGFAVTARRRHGRTQLVFLRRV